MSEIRAQARINLLVKYLLLLSSELKDYLISRHQVGLSGHLHALATLALEWVPGIQWTRGSVSHRAGPDAVEYEKCTSLWRYLSTNLINEIQ